MFGIGLNLSFDDFKRVFTFPKAIIYGLVGQLVVLPLIGFLLAYLVPLEPAYKIGIVLIAICPGGTSSNIVTYMLKGRVALSVSITAFNSFLIVLTIPILLRLAFYLFEPSGTFAELTLYQTFFEVIYTVLIPVVGGILIGHFFPAFAKNIQPLLRYILPGLLFAVFLLAILLENANSTKSLQEYWDIFVPAFLLNFSVILIGFYSSRLINLPHEDQYTIAVEMGLQNSALAIFLANNVLHMEGVALVAVVYGSFTFFTTLFFGYVLKNYVPKAK